MTSVQFKNEKAVWAKILEVYKDRPHMWDKKNKHYYNRDLKRQGFELMFEIYSEYDNNSNLTIFKKKLENMRAAFFKQCKKVNASKRTGSGKDDILVYTPSLWYFNLFAFLEETNEPSSIEEVTIDNMDEDPLTEQPSTSFSNQNEPIPKRKKILTSNDATRELVGSVTECFERPEYEVDIIAKIWAKKLSRLAPDQRRFAEKIINDTLFEAELGTLTRNGVHFITLESPASSVSHIIYSSPSERMVKITPYSPGGTANKTPHTCISSECDNEQQTVTEYS